MNVDEDLFECRRGLELAVETLVTVRCPFTDEYVEYKVRVTYRSNGKCFKLEALDALLNDIARGRATQEALTQAIVSWLEEMGVGGCVEAEGSHLGGRYAMKTRACTGEGRI